MTLPSVTPQIWGILLSFRWWLALMSASFKEPAPSRQNLQTVVQRWKNWSKLRVSWKCPSVRSVN